MTGVQTCALPIWSGHLHCQHNDDLITSGQSWPPKQAPSCECLMTCRDNFRSPLIHHTGREWSAQHVRLILGSGSSAQCDRPISSRHAPAATCQLRAAFSAIEYKSITIQLTIKLLRERTHIFRPSRPARTSAVSVASSASSDRCPSTPNSPARGCAQSFLRGRTADSVAGLLERRLGLA